MTAKDWTMTTSTFGTMLGRRLWISGIVFAIAAALVSALWLSSSPAPAAVEQTAATLGTELGSDDSPAPGTDTNRKELRADLKAARALEGQARIDALKKVRAGAAAGEYGDKIEKRADRRSDRHAAYFALLPDDLQADLKELKAMPAGDERKAKREQIREDALAGKYGEKVQEAAKLLQRD